MGVWVYSYIFIFYFTALTLTSMQYEGFTSIPLQFHIYSSSIASIVFIVNFAAWLVSFIVVWTRGTNSEFLVIFSSHQEILNDQQTFCTGGRHVLAGNLNQIKRHRSDHVFWVSKPTKFDSTCLSLNKIRNEWKQTLILLPKNRNECDLDRQGLQSKIRPLDTILSFTPRSL